MGRPKKNAGEGESEGRTISSRPARSRTTSNRDATLQAPSLSPDVYPSSSSEGLFSDFNSSHMNASHYGHPYNQPEHRSPLHSEQQPMHGVTPWMTQFPMYQESTRLWHPNPHANSSGPDPYDSDTTKLRQADSLPAVTQRFDQQSIDSMLFSLYTRKLLSELQ